MFRLARFSVRYPTTVMMFVLGVILLGYISFQRLGMDLLPHLNTPKLFIEVKAGERPPEEVEEQFVDQLESIAARGRMVRNVFSLSRVGKALITVEYQWNADMDEAFLDLQKSIADFAQNSEADEINVSQLDPNAQPVVVAVLTHDEVTDLDRLRQTAENNIRNELIRLPSVAAVDLVGERKREVEVKTDAYTLQAYGLNMDQLSTTIQSSNRNLSGGSIVEMGLRYIIRGIGELASPDDLNNLIVAYQTKQQGNQETAERTPIYLKDVADVSYVLSEPENIVRFNGRQCLALEIFKEANTNTTQASRSILENLESLERSLPGYNIHIIQDQARFIKSAIGEVEETGIIGVILAVLVLFAFLRRFSVTAVISLAIPISIIATFNLMYFNRLTLNIMTLGGLALGAGMLVDNAIVVVENIFRHTEAGLPVKEAAVRGTGEVGGAITSSTLTTIIVFLPIVYLHGVAGELFKEQAWTVAFSLLSSLLVALCVIPMLFSRLIKPRQRPAGSGSIHFPFYGRFLAVILRKRWLVVLLAAGLVAAAFLSISFVGSEFMPHPGQNELFINLMLPEGTSLERTEGVVRNIEALIQEASGEQAGFIYCRIGPKGISLSESEILADENNAVIQLVLKPRSKLSLENLIGWLDKELSAIPDLSAQFIRQQTTLQTTLGTESAPLIVEVKGKNLDTLAGLADSVKEKLAALPELANVETSFQAGRPEINIEIDKELAARFGLRSESIGTQIKNFLSGRELGEMEDEGEYIRIMLRTPEVSISQIGDLVLEASSGRRIRLDEIARLARTESPREIIRKNQTRVAEVRAYINGNTPFDKIASRVKREVSTVRMGEDYSFSITGEELMRRESFSNLKFALLLAIVLVYMVMAAQFESLLHPFVILLTIPLAGVGAVFLLLILGMPFNIMSYIGLIMLAGIAVNDSIILVDMINQNRRAGQALDEAIIFAGQMRIRPIIMTSLTTILALLPLTIGIGEGASLRAPLAAAVIGGLLSSTTLTLIVIPAVYRLLAKKPLAARGPGR